MTFMESVRTCLKENYCNFEGRAPRSEYWWFALFAVLLGIVTSIIDGILGTVTANGIGLISSIASLALIIPSIAVAVRRLHDTDRSGWFYLLNFIPIIGWIVLIIFFVQQGTNGRNRFGDDPL